MEDPRDKKSLEPKPTRKKGRRPTGRKKTSSPRVSTSYRALTKGGTRFVPLNPKNFAKLKESEQRNIKKMADYTDEDMRQVTKEDWESLKKAGLEVATYRRYNDIVNGKAVNDIEDSIIKNFTKGLIQAGRKDLAERFEKLASNYRTNDPSRFDVFMKEVPDLYLYYKDKGKSHVKRQATFSQSVASDQIEQTEAILDAYEKEDKEKAEE